MEGAARPARRSRWRGVIRHLGQLSLAKRGSPALPGEGPLCRGATLESVRTRFTVYRLAPSRDGRTLLRCVNTVPPTSFKLALQLAGVPP